MVEKEEDKMSLNFKKINEVPVVNKVQENDMLLLNSNGEAKQIPANKFSTSGGGSGGGMIYGYALDTSPEAFQAFADAELTQPLTYAEGKTLLLGGAGIISGQEGMAVRIQPLLVMPYDTQKAAHASIVLGETPSAVFISFSDSISA